MFIPKINNNNTDKKKIEKMTIILMTSKQIT